MKRLELFFACQNSDRTRALIDGRVQVEGVDIFWVPVDPEEIFHRAFRHQEFDACEISLGTHLTLTAREGSPFVGVPAFLSRAFRHSAIYIRRGGRIARATDLVGARVGVPDYQQTAALWVRGMLLDQYQVHARDVKWCVGGLEQPGRKPRRAGTLPADIAVEPIGSADTLSQLLLDGKLDAIVSPRKPSCFTERPDLVDRLFPNFRTVEEEYYRRCKCFPIMHAVGVRRTVHSQHPWLAGSLYKALLASRDIGLREIQETNYLRASLPWLHDDLERVRAVFGANYWTYGVADARIELESMARYAFEDGLAPRLVSPDELFAVSTVEMFRN
jgi:4,5-dihydroxyphthalate decarboxylase